MGKFSCVFGSHDTEKHPYSYHLPVYYNEVLRVCKNCGIYWCITDLTNEKHFYTRDFDKLTPAMQACVLRAQEELAKNNEDDY